jgi:hypothetical protein
MEQQERWTETQQSSEESYMGSFELNEQELLDVVGGKFPTGRVIDGGLATIAIAGAGYILYLGVTKQI